MPDPVDPTDSLESSDLMRELQALPPKQAAAVVLRYFHGYTNREIGHALGLPERTVASRLIRARARLQERLGHLRYWRTPLPAGVPLDD